MSTALSKTAAFPSARGVELRGWNDLDLTRLIGVPKFQITPAIRAVLRECYQAYAYAKDLDCSLWDFAVEISTFKRLGLTRSDLRWMVGQGLLECAIETSKARDAERTFRHPPRLLFSKRTCFVLTPNCARLASKCTDRRDCADRNACGKPGERSHLQPESLSVWQSDSGNEIQEQPLVPAWDRDRQTLKVGRAIVKHFKVPAGNQQIVLAAFEEESWPVRIDDPLPPHGELEPKKRLRETIKSLNRNQKESLIRFFGDGSGQGIRWEFRGDHPLATTQD